MGAQPSPSPEEEIVKIGSVLDGRYRIDAILGTGGMGRVYRAEHTGIGRPVAIKVLHADLGRSREAAQRFQREAIASGRLDHANIVGVSDFGYIDDGPCYLVMEALEGESLGARLERDKRIPWQEAIAIIRGVLHGLRHAHERGVVHRDIKPDNVFLAMKEGELVVKILDFGIAKLAAGTADDPASTRAGLTVGTPAYLSPEQAVGGEITPACDLYSTTIVLYEMLTGRTPFDETDPLAMLGAHVGRPPPPLHEIAPELVLPPGLEEVIERGLAKLQAERTSSALDYLALLDQVAPAMPKSSNPAITLPPGVYATPPHGAPIALGSAPTAAALARTPNPAATPMPLSIASRGFPPDPPLVTSGHMTPMPGMNSSDPSIMITVSPVGATSLLDVTMPPPPVPPPTTPAPTMSPLPVAARRPTVADAGFEIPKRWLAVGGAVLVGLLIVAVVLLAVRHSKTGATVVPAPTTTTPPTTPVKPEAASKPEPKAVKPADSAAKTVPPAAGSAEIPPAGSAAESPADVALKAALHDLQNGKTCPERKAAVARLVTLNDPRALPHLKTARYRMVGGVLGLGQDNANACLTADATAAIKKLSPPPKPAPKPAPKGKK